MTLRLYNTLTRTKEDFVPLDAKNVRMYVCGPTVYDFAHIGNARPAIVFDVLFRLLRHVYGEEHVTYVRNITDVDDKINARAAQEHPDLPLNEAIRLVTEKTATQYHADIAALGCLPPTSEPRATENIASMIAMNERLIAAGHAYAAEGHVLYDVSSKPDYGKLARRSLDEMMAGARVEIAPYKKNPMDFVLWKPSTPDQPGWESPWGRGRPGWHIECSAMSEALLGETFDIHGGGIDLVFPHHENEIAQSEGAHRNHPLAKVWMHNGFLQVEGEKMSKSLGNFVTIRELREGWKGYAWPGEALRFNMLRTHYRDPIDWTFEGLDESHKALWDWARLLETEAVGSVGQLPASSVIDALNDDLNTPQVITELHALKKKGDLRSLSASLQFLGFSGDVQNVRRNYVLRAEAGKILVSGSHLTTRVIRADGTTEIDAESDAEVQKLVDARTEARKAKNFRESDRIRDELLAKGIVLKDGPTGTTWEVKR
jgi:cysteinyl-tRNA synthetase